jgi:long-chain fatty acid transport protein
LPGGLGAQAPFNSALGKVSGDDIGYGFTLGLTWNPLPGTQLGIGFRSAIDHTLEGRQTLELSPVTVGGCRAGSACSVPITANITLPELVTVGLRQNITADIAVSASVEWQNWSRARVVAINGSPTGSTLVLNYRDGWYFALGADWRVRPDLTLRAGIGYEITPVRDEFRSVSIPDSDRLWLSAGLTYDVSNQLSISSSYTFIQLADSTVNRPANADGTAGLLVPGVGRVGYSATIESQIHIFGISASYKWNPPPPAAEPVVARY